MQDYVRMMANEQSSIHFSSHPSGKIPQARTETVAVLKYSLIDQVPAVLFFNCLSSCCCYSLHDQIPAAICFKSTKWCWPLYARWRIPYQNSCRLSVFSVNICGAKLVHKSAGPCKFFQMHDSSPGFPWPSHFVRHQLYKCFNQIFKKKNSNSAMLPCVFKHWLYICSTHYYSCVFESEFYGKRG